MNIAFRQLIDRSIIIPLQQKGARLLTKAALFVVAAFAFLIAFVFLTAAFFIWIVQLAGLLAAALSVAGLYLGIGTICILAAIYSGRNKTQKTHTQDSKRPENITGNAAQLEDTAVEDARAAAITEAIIPLLEVLRSLGWKREELALLASAELAKKLPPLTLAGLAIIFGFWIARMDKFKFDLFQKKSS